MLKRMVVSLLTSVGLLSLTAHPTLAKLANHFATHETVYPSTCSVAVDGERYTCDYVVVGAFNDATANIKLCSSQSCFILMLNRTQFSHVANGQDFSVYNLAWQRGRSIVHQWDTSMRCGFTRSDGLGCVGELEDGSAIAIYME